MAYVLERVIIVFGSIKRWLIFKLIGDQPVVMNIDVALKKQTYKINKPILIKNATLD